MGELGKPLRPAGRVAVLVAIGSLTSFVAVYLSDALAILASLAGSLFVMITSVLFPAVLRLGFSEAPTGWSSVFHYANLAFIITFGIVLAILGTSLAVSDLWRGRN